VLSPWVMEEIRSHPYRMWAIQAVGILVFTLILIHRMPTYEYTTYVYPAKSPRVEAQKSDKAVKSRQMGVSNRVTVKLSQPSRRATPRPLPGTPVPSASVTATPSGPSEPSPVPTVPSVQPSEPTTPPVDLETSPPVTQAPTTRIPVTSSTK
jgi:hypothetical protein